MQAMNATVRRTKPAAPGNKPKPATPRLSKSRIQSGRQCHKRLWLEIHQPDAIQWDDSAQARLDQGTAFGELARDLLGGGLLIEADHRHFDQALAQTRDALSCSRSRLPRLFEAAFEFQGVRVRVDALERGRNSDTLIEVKSSTGVKDEYLWDCAIQAWVLRGAGRPLRQIALAHVNNQFVYTREGDYDGLLAIEDITAEVEALLPSIPALVTELKRVAKGDLPRISTGAHCHTPYECPLLAYCQAREPKLPDYPVDVLPRGHALIAQLRAQGHVDIRTVPDHLLTRDTHKRIAAATRDNKPFVSDDFASILDAIAYPRFHLDFETIQYVVPRWLGTRPFEQLPFQFSCHVEDRGGTLRQEAFLDVSGHPPLAALVDRLIEVVGKSGPILVWNQGFEGRCIRELAARFPEKRKALLRIVDRLVDLLPIFREHYYHRDMLGSWSIKAVLPTIAPDLDYGDLDVGDGGAVQLAYLEAIAPDTTARRREELRSQMLAYCERDTLAMVRLSQWRPAAAVRRANRGGRAKAS